MSDDETFGRRLLAFESTTARFEDERAKGKRKPFEEVDAALATIITAALSGERVLERPGDENIELGLELPATQRQALDQHFKVGAQEKRGAWHLPTKVDLIAGRIQLAYWQDLAPRLLMNKATAENCKRVSTADPLAVAIWAIQPLFEELILPIRVRAGWLGEKGIDQQERLWARIDPVYSALELDGPALDAFRPGSGWAERTSADIVALREALIGHWAKGAAEASDRYRLHRIGLLAERFYAKSKRAPALRSKVLDKVSERTLTACFGGDWLAFLHYLGEEPNPKEAIVQALPETKLIVGGKSRAADVAAEHGLPTEAIEKLLASYWKGSDSSPVELRVNCLRRYWEEFDALHVKQAAGERSLWGLVEEHAFIRPIVPQDDDGPGDHDSELHQKLLSAPLERDINELWGTKVLARWPEALVSEPHPHVKVAEALGPALKAWQGIALTCYFVCVGPTSRTDLSGLARYHERDLTVLESLGYPIDPTLFEELKAAEDEHGTPDRGPIYTIEVSLGEGGVSTKRGRNPRAKGVSFEQLNEIVTRQRRAWTAANLDAYLRTSWELQLREVGVSQQRTIADKGKELTPKQFAKLAAPAANLWFGGDLSGVSRALGLKALETPVRRARLVPDEPNEFATRLFEELTGDKPKNPPSWREDREARERWNNLSHLASFCVDFLQLEEALGRPPELKEFGRSRFKARSDILAEDPDEAWKVYEAGIAAVRADSAEGRT